MSYQCAYCGACLETLTGGPAPHHCFNWDASSMALPGDKKVGRSYILLDDAMLELNKWKARAEHFEKALREIVEACEPESWGYKIARRALEEKP